MSTPSAFLITHSMIRHLWHMSVCVLVEKGKSLAGRGRAYVARWLRIWLLSKPVQPANVHFREAGTLAEARVCLFAHYTPDGTVDESTLNYVRQLAGCGLSVIFVHGGKLSPIATAQLKRQCHAVLSTPNGGYDFAMWKAAMLTIPGIWQADELLLVNNSVWIVRDIHALFDRMNAVDCDFWGCTFSQEGNVHLQSFFLCFRQICLNHRAFIEFWDHVAILPQKVDVIRQYEQRLTRHLTRYGLRAKSFVPLAVCRDRNNPTLRYPQMLLVDYEMPFVKKQLVRENPYGVPLSSVQDTLRRLGVTKTLMRTMFPSDMHDTSESGAECQVLLCTHNGESHLQELLDSLPSSPKVCILARDDASSDASPAILARHAAKLGGRMRVCQGKQLGCVGNFSWLLERVDAPYFMLADQDDIWAEEKYMVLLDAMYAMEARYGAELPLLVYADTRLVDTNGNMLSPSGFRTQATPPTWGEDFCHALVMSNATGCTIMGNRTLARMASPIPAEAYMHDWWLLLVATGLGAARVVDKPLVSYRQHSSNVLGANRYGFADALKTSWREHRYRLRHTQLQASTFLERFGPSLSPLKRDLCAAWADMPRHTWLTRLLASARYRFTKPGFYRQIGMLICN